MRASLLLSLLAGSGSALAGELPRVQARWEPGQVLFTVEGPRGEHVQAEAPASGWLSVGETRVEVEGTGALLTAGVAVPTDTWRAREVRGALDLSLCEDGGTLCRIVELDLQGTLEGRSGKARMAVSPRRKPTSRAVAEAPPPRQPTVRPGVDAGTPPHVDPDAAFAAALQGRRPILLDFSAVWCPPCNLLAQQVLHDPADRELLARFTVVEIDADHRNSWALKDRYAVGGYPTVVVTRPDGTELDRFVGYTDEASFVAWLGDLGGRPPVTAPPDPRTLAPRDAGALALRMVEAGREAEAAPYLARAAEGATTPELRLARVRIDANRDDALWLCAERPDWLARFGWAVAAAEPTPDAELADALLRAVQARLPAAAPAEASDLQALAGRVLERRGAEAASRLAYAGAASTLAATLRGTAEEDRPWLTTLADLWASAGEVDAALAVLARGVEAWPHDPTFFLASARLLNAQGRFEEALPYAVGGAALAWGDNQLRLSAETARALHGLGRSAEALALVDRVLAEAERPAEGVDVRTPRYLAALEALRAELAGP